MTERIFDTDILVVGGGPAGLAAAIAARQQGFRVTVADWAKPPIDKACGEGIMPDGLAALLELGVDLEGCETASFCGIKFISPESSVAAEFPQGYGLGIRRLILHERFIEQAERLGVQLLWGVRVSAASNKTLLINGNAIACQWIIGADGRHSQVRKLAGLSASTDQGQRIGMRQHFQIPLWSDFVEIYWGDKEQAYVTPVGKNEVCVALISRKRFTSFDSGLSQFPELANHLRNGIPTTSVRGAVTPSLQLKSVVRGNIALIGEASGSVDAITGEGLAMTFRQAMALARALKTNDLSLYEAAHRTIAGLPNFMSRSMLLLDKNSWLRKRSLRAFAKKPALFKQLLSVHVRGLRIRDFGITGMLNLGWQVLTA